MTSTVRVRIEGVELPGRSCAPSDAPARYDNVHVGVQRGREVVELVAGNAASARWTFEVTTRIDKEGATDFAGPFVHGKRGDQFLYLSWGTVDGAGAFTMFRRAKLNFADVDPDALRRAVDDDGGTLVGRIGLTDGRGNPRCARVRPPDIMWTYA